nr:probable sulfate transporter 3.5 [Tanacetum cinerariifolium]
MAPVRGLASGETCHKVNFAAPKSFATSFKSDLKETFFPNDPFHDFKGKPLPIKSKKALQYFVPIFGWFPSYTRHDIIPLRNSKASDDSSFVPPLIYLVFGSSKHLAEGTVATSSLIIAATIGAKVNPSGNPQLYLNLVFTTTLISGVTQLILGVFQLGILVDFLSHSTITGFMGGTATLICKVGQLNKGINPSSLKKLDFDTKYISAPIQAGLITAMIALA